MWHLSTVIKFACIILCPLVMAQAQLIPFAFLNKTADTGGYFVLSNGTYNGNMGGISGANSLCLNDLSNNNWKGKAEAQARGLLTASKVFAFQCTSTNCISLTPLKSYAFAVSGNPAVGGAKMTADSSGLAPHNNDYWNSVDHFGGNFSYRGRLSASGLPAEYWSNTPPSLDTTCNNWTSIDNEDEAWVGYSHYDNAGARWSDDSDFPCSTPIRMICIVQP